MAATAELRLDSRDAGWVRLTAGRWPRLAAQWLIVGAAHAAVLAGLLQVSPQARRFANEVIHASLLPPLSAKTPQPRMQSEPPKPLPPRRSPQPEPAPSAQPSAQPETPAPLLAVAAPASDPAPDAFVVPAPPPQPVSDTTSASPGSGAGSQAGASATTAASQPAPQPAPPPLVPPLYSAAYLENPPPAYPPMSRRLGETGRVLLRAYVSAAGRAERVEVKHSSGFERLDRAARDAVASWRFEPARRGDEPVAAWVQVPIVFVM